MAEPPAEWRGHLGRKVSLRYRLQGDPRHPFSEAVGVVQSVGGDPPSLEIVTKRGEIVTIGTDDVFAARLF